MTRGIPFPRGWSNAGWISTPEKIGAVEIRGYGYTVCPPQRRNAAVRCGAARSEKPEN
jgi:hypothetical protein